MTDVYTEKMLLETLAIDYLTMTTRHVDIVQSLYREMIRELKDVSTGDPNHLPEKVCSCGPFYASSLPRQPARNGCQLRIAGLSAAQWAPVVAEYIDRINVSRLDLQVTLPMHSAPDLDELYGVLSSPDKFPWKQPGKPPQTTLISNTLGGKTLYIGKRTSDLMTRLYHKTTPNGKYMRWELEIKGRLARSLANQGILTDRSQQATFARAVLAGYPDGVSQQLLPFGEAVGAPTGEISRTGAPTSEEATLQWFTRTVIPALKNAMRGSLREEVLRLMWAHGVDVRWLNGYNAPASQEELEKMEFERNFRN